MQLPWGEFQSGHQAAPAKGRKPAAVTPSTLLISTSSAKIPARPHPFDGCL